MRGALMLAMRAVPQCERTGEERGRRRSTCTDVGLVCPAAVQAAAHLQAEHELVALRLVLALEAAVLLHVATVVPAFGTKRAQASASWRSGGGVRRQSTPQAAPCPGRPRPVSHLGRVGQHAGLGLDRAPRLRIWMLSLDTKISSLAMSSFSGCLSSWLRALTSCTASCSYRLVHGLAHGCAGAVGPNFCPMSVLMSWITSSGAGGPSSTTSATRPSSITAGRDRLVLTRSGAGPVHASATAAVSMAKSRSERGRQNDVREQS